MNCHCEMDFKNERIREEMETVKSGEHGFGLWTVMEFTNAVSFAVSGKPILVTGIFRRRDEQLAIYEIINKQRIADGLEPIRPVPASVHEYWRGFDFRWWIYTAEELQLIIEIVNRAFRYRGRLKVLAFHKHGTAPHAHGQVPQLWTWAPAGKVA